MKGILAMIKKKTNKQNKKHTFKGKGDKKEQVPKKAKSCSR
jgi:hypothetical protein